MHWDEGREHFWKIVLSALHEKEAALVDRAGLRQRDASSSSLPGC